MDRSEIPGAASTNCAALRAASSGLRIDLGSGVPKFAALEPERPDGSLRDRTERLDLIVRGGQRGDDLLCLGRVRFGDVAERVLRLAAAERLRDDQHRLSVRHGPNYGTDAH